MIKINLKRDKRKVCDKCHGKLLKVGYMASILRTIYWCQHCGMLAEVYPEEMRYFPSRKVKIWTIEYSIQARHFKNEKTKDKRAKARS